MDNDDPFRTVEELAECLDVSIADTKALRLRQYSPLGLPGRRRLGLRGGDLAAPIDMRRPDVQRRFRKSAPACGYA